jgi:hypothetical protein
VGFAQKVDDLFDRELLKRLAETVQVLVELDRGVLHVLVGGLGTADQKEMFRPCDSMLAVAVETDAEETHDFTFVLLGFGRHRASSLPPGFVTALLDYTLAHAVGSIAKRHSVRRTFVNSYEHFMLQWPKIKNGRSSKMEHERSESIASKAKMPSGSDSPISAESVRNGPASQSPIVIPLLIKQAQNAFFRDLPQLLTERPGQWVGYRGDHRIGFAPTDLELYQKCHRQGIPVDEFLVLRIEAEASETVYGPYEIG